MDERKNQLTVYFEDPFWVGVLERIEDGALSVCKVTFGAEPKDYEVWDFILKYYDRLEFSPSVAVAAAKKNRGNPKRQQREARKQTAAVGRDQSSASLAVAARGAQADEKDRES